MPITAEHSSMSQTGMATGSGVWPLMRKRLRRMTPMNFCPSCAPCIKLMAAAPKICAARKTGSVLRRSALRKSSTTILHMTQPRPKPSTTEITRP